MRVNFARCCAALLAVPLLACTAAVTVTGPQDASTDPGVAIHGRVLDLETCPSVSGCRVVVGVVVSRSDAPAVLSEPTGPDGAFVLSGVVPGTAPLLRVEATTGMVGSYVTTLNANPVAVQGADVFGVELYVLSAADQDLLGAIAAESTRDLRSSGGYVGEVIRREPTAAAVASAHVELFPGDYPMRYVNVIPRYVPAEAVLQPATAGSTSGFGLFAVAALEEPGDLGVLVTADGLTFEPLLVPMAPGTVVFGLHVGTPAPVDGGTD